MIMDVEYRIEIYKISSPDKKKKLDGVSKTGPIRMLTMFDQILHFAGRYEMFGRWAFFFLANPTA